ncbi:hypothetical protein NKG94_15860 [Micromonospora sp. M12]
MILGQELVPGGAPMKPEQYEPTIREQFQDHADAVLARYPRELHLRRRGAGHRPHRCDLVGTHVGHRTAAVDLDRDPNVRVQRAQHSLVHRLPRTQLPAPRRPHDRTALPLRRHRCVRRRRPRTGNIPKPDARNLDRLRHIRNDELAALPRRPRPRQALSSNAWQRANFTTDHNYGFWKNLR